MGSLPAQWIVSFGVDIVSVYHIVVIDCLLCEV